VLAVLFGVLAGACFGALAVAVRVGLRRGTEPVVGAAVASAMAFGATAVIVAVSRSSVQLDDVWPFVLIGMLVPGASQILFVLAVRDAGPSRAAILIGTAPLMSVLIALTILDEPFSAAILIATLLIVAGGAALTRERVRPADFKAVGAFLGLACAALFAVRDNLVRGVARDLHPPPLSAAAASLLGAAGFLAVYLVATRRRDLTRRVRTGAVDFLPAGLALTGGYVCLLEAFSHGRVSIVAPLNATQSLWAVGFSALVLGKAEAIGPRLVLASVLIVSGGVLIGVAR